MIIDRPIEMSLGLAYCKYNVFMLPQDFQNKQDFEEILSPL